MATGAIDPGLLRHFLEMRGWDNGQGYSFQPWVKTCGENVQKLKAKGVEHLSERPEGHWQDGEWVGGTA